MIEPLILQAILGSHGYKVHENYAPVWRNVRVPEVFLVAVYPMAEEIVEKIEGRVCVPLLEHPMTLPSLPTFRQKEPIRRIELLADAHRAAPVPFPGEKGRFRVVTIRLADLRQSARQLYSRSDPSQHYSGCLPWHGLTFRSG